LDAKGFILEKDQKKTKKRPDLKRQRKRQREKAEPESLLQGQCADKKAEQGFLRYFENEVLIGERVILWHTVS